MKSDLGLDASISAQNVVCSLPPGSGFPTWDTEGHYTKEPTAYTRKGREHLPTATPLKPMCHSL